MNTHTPGPWTAEDDGDIDIVSRDPEANEFYIVARMFGPEADANARLIAAAPDLLDVCKRLVDHAGIDMSLGPAEVMEFVRIYTEMRAAIAKAEGVS